jgi:hypothetical protein
MNDEELQKCLKQSIDATINYLASICNLEINHKIQEIISTTAIFQIETPEDMYDFLLELTKRVAERMIPIRIEAGKNTVRQIREMDEWKY